jgi:hypothetical protein
VLVPVAHYRVRNDLPLLTLEIEVPTVLYIQASCFRFIKAMYNASEADVLFKKLDLELMENIDGQYFSESREFRYGNTVVTLSFLEHLTKLSLLFPRLNRSLNEVLEVLGQKVDQINRTAGDASKDLLTVLKVTQPLEYVFS